MLRLKDASLYDKSLDKEINGGRVSPKYRFNYSINGWLLYALNGVASEVDLRASHVVLRALLFYIKHGDDAISEYNYGALDRTCSLSLASRVLSKLPNKLLRGSNGLDSRLMTNIIASYLSTLGLEEAELEVLEKVLSRGRLD